MDNRPKPRVKAVEPIAADMLVPFVVLASDRKGSGPFQNRTTFYLVDGFRRLYGARIRELPSWPSWVAINRFSPSTTSWPSWVTALRMLAPHAEAAFKGDENLHAYTRDIARLKAVYDSLTSEAAERGLTWHH